MARVVQSFSKLWKKARENPCEFSVWTNLLDLVEKQQNIEHARKAFESFFEHFPYCYGYWKKFADMERHKGNKENSLKVYEAGVKAIPLSVDLWTAYLDATMEFYHGRDDYESRMRSLYEEALEAVGLDFRSDALWEHYISWESGHNRLLNVVAIYTRLLQIPTQLYFQNWDSFNKLVEDNRPEDLLSAPEFARLHAQVSLSTAKTLSFEQPKSEGSDDTEPPIVGVTKPAVEITDASRAAIRQLIIDSRECIYQDTYSQIMKRWYFEEKIRRPYFHVKPLEEAQLNNWAEYLSFEEAEAAAAIDAVKSQCLQSQLSETEIEQVVSISDAVSLTRRRVRLLYERCLIACALYEHFWIRYARYLEFKENDVPAAREVWRRVCTIHLRYKPTVHWHWCLFEERYPSNLDVPPTLPVHTCLDILTGLEERLTDSALVCFRRADAMRRAGKPLFDIIACLRNGINRLRFLAQEQNKVAKSVSGATASRTVAQAIATGSQARAGAGVLAGRLARLLHRDELCDGGVPLWMLLLNTVYKEEEIEHDEEDDFEEQDVPEPANEQVVKMDDEMNEAQSPSSGTEGGEPEVAGKLIEIADDSSNAEMESDDEIEDNNDTRQPPVDNSMASGSDSEMMDQQMDDSGSPPVLVSRPGVNKGELKREHAEEANLESEPKRAKSDKVSDNDADKKATDDGTLDAPVAEQEEKPVEEQDKTELQRDLAAEEEERIRQLLDKRYRLIHITAPAPESLTEEDKVIVSGEEAAIRVLKEAIEYDPRNERLYGQILDIAYQRRPVDIKGFIEFADLAIMESILPANIKLAFSQRKLQFLEEFDQDLCRLNVAYEEYLNLCEAVNLGLTASAVARGVSHLAPGYPLPDLLNLPTASLRVSSVALAAASAGTGDSLVSSGPVSRQPFLSSDQSALEAAASVGTPAPDPSTSAGYYTAGGYEPLAAALGNTSGLPPAAPTNVPLMTPGIALVPGTSLAEGAASWAAAATVDPYATYYYTATSSTALGVPSVSLEFDASACSSSGTSTTPAITSVRSSAAQ